MNNDAERQVMKDAALAWAKTLHFPMPVTIGEPSAEMQTWDEVGRARIVVTIEIEKAS